METKRRSKLPPKVGRKKPNAIGFSLLISLTPRSRAAAQTPPPVESWRDVDLADRCARRNAGLDDSERNQNINIGMQLVEARLLSIELPKDAPRVAPLGSSKTPRNPLPHPVSEAKTSFDFGPSLPPLHSPILRSG